MQMMQLIARGYITPMFMKRLILNSVLSNLQKLNSGFGLHNIEIWEQSI